MQMKTPAGVHRALHQSVHLLNPKPHVVPLVSSLQPSRGSLSTGLVTWKGEHFQYGAGAPSDRVRGSRCSTFMEEYSFIHSFSRQTQSSYCVLGVMLRHKTHIVKQRRQSCSAQTARQKQHLEVSEGILAGWALHGNGKSSVCTSSGPLGVEEQCSKRPAWALLRWGHLGPKRVRKGAIRCPVEGSWRQLRSQVGNRASLNPTQEGTHVASRQWWRAEGQVVTEVAGPHHTGRRGHHEDSSLHSR